MPPGADIAANLADVRRRIDAAAQRARRSPADITLVSVSKTFSAAAVRAAAAAGQRHFGENRVQEGLDKIAELRDLDLDWHLIGHLQSNKAKKAAEAFGWIESIDRLELVSKVGAAASARTSPVRVLIQVDLAHEATKHGAGEEELPELTRAAIDAAGLDVLGLMIVPPFPERPEDSRPWFRRLRELRDTLVRDGIPADRLHHLSMGMSQDFEVAIEEGATMVRVGTAIFGSRTVAKPATEERR
jgi:pyridoxal phosphate enzyme (YggS family)